MPAPIELYRDSRHICLMFTDLVEEDGQAVQANQFLIVDNGTGAIIDPGGNLAFNELFLPVADVPRGPGHPPDHLSAGSVLAGLAPASLLEVAQRKHHAQA